MRPYIVAAALAAPLALAPLAASAQEDSVFRNYDAYDAFVDDHIYRRDFIPLIQRLGARDEYTKEQLAGIERQFLGIYGADFTEDQVFRTTDMGGGFSSEMRAYWGPAGYIWFGALLHERPDGDFVVINFRLNSNVGPVLAEY